MTFSSFSRSALPQPLFLLLVGLLLSSRSMMAQAPVQANEPSDPYLMTGFDQKTLHLTNDSDRAVNFTVEVDFTGTGHWRVYDVFRVEAQGYRHYEFPAGYSAHWVRLRTDKICKTTAVFTYN